MPASLIRLGHAGISKWLHIVSCQTLRRGHPGIAIAIRYPDHWYLGFALIANGQPDEAITVLENASFSTDRNPAVMGVLVRAYAHAGRRAKRFACLMN